MDGLGLATINSRKLFSTSTGLNFNFISTNVFESLNILDIWTVCRIDSSPDDVKMLLKNETNILYNNWFCINKFSKILLILMETVLIELFYKLFRFLRLWEIKNRIYDTAPQKTCLAVRPKHRDSLLNTKILLTKTGWKYFESNEICAKDKGHAWPSFFWISDTLTL